MDTAVNVTGGCLCGDVRFRCSGEIAHRLVCHCRMCQRASGSAFLALLFFPMSAFTVTKGRTQTYQSSSTGIRHFCGRCGASLFFERTSSALCGIHVGALDDPGIFEPAMHICLSARQPWVELPEGVAQYEEKPAGMTPTGEYDSVTGCLVEHESAAGTDSSTDSGHASG